MGDSTFLTSIKVADSSNIIKQRQRNELLQSLGTTGSKILQAHKELQTVADELDNRVEQLLNNNEKDFFLAYKTHMYQVQKEFKVLKSKADEEETKTRRDAKIGSLEKELSWFMNEALRLDDLCKKYKQQVDKWKQRATSLDDDRRFLENQIRMAKKHNRHLRAAVEKTHNSAYQTAAAAEEEEAAQEQIVEVEEEQTPLSRESTIRYAQTIKNLQHQLQVEKRTLCKLRDNKKLLGDTSMLEQYFLQCIEQVKGEIFDRRYASYRTNTLAMPPAGRRENIPLSNEDITVESFTVSDRRRVIDLLFKDPDIQNLVYTYDASKLNNPKGGESHEKIQLPVAVS